MIEIAGLIALIATVPLIASLLFIALSVYTYYCWLVVGWVLGHLFKLVRWGK